MSIADLLGMTSGIQDYDGLLYMDWTLLFGQVRLQLQQGSPIGIAAVSHDLAALRAGGNGHNRLGSGCAALSKHIKMALITSDPAALRYPNA